MGTEQWSMATIEEPLICMFAGSLEGYRKNVWETARRVDDGQRGCRTPLLFSIKFAKELLNCLPRFLLGDERHVIVAGIL